MNERADPRLVKRCSAIASASALFTILAGVLGIAGWELHIAVLDTWAIARVRIAPNAAACLTLLGICLWLHRKEATPPIPSAKKTIAKILAAFVCLVALLSLAEFFLGWDLGIDQVLATVSPGEQIPGVRVGLMASIAAFDFLALGIALLLSDWKTKRGDWPAQFLCIGAAIGSVFGVFALALQPKQTGITMALPAAVTFFFLACGVVCSRARWAVGGLLTSQSAGAKLLRKVIPASLLVLSLIGWSVSKALLTEAHFTWVEASLLAIGCGTLLVGFVTWVAFIVERSDAERKKVEEALQVSKEQLDRLLERIEDLPGEARLRREVTTGFVVAVFLTGLLGVLSWRAAGQAAEDSDRVAHTHQVITGLESTLRHLLDMESSGSGLAVTGNPAFLESYDTAKTAVGQDLSGLRVLIADNPEQTGRLGVLSSQAEARIASLEEVVAAQQRDQKVPVVPQFQRGKKIMDAARITVAQMEAAEKLLLEQRGQRTRAARHLTSLVVALGSILGVVFLVIAGASVNREINISVKARDQVIALNADLERRVAERTSALRESEGRLAGVIQSAMDSIITVDEQHRIVLFNTAAERVFRCSAAEVLGQPIARFVPKRFHAAHSEHIRKFGETGVTSRALDGTGSLWAVRDDGEEFQIEASISKIETASKKLLTIILRDVTERKRAEEALRESERRYRDLFSEMVVGFTVLEAISDENGKPYDFRYVEVNPAFERQSGLPGDKAVGKTIREVLPGLDPFWIETYGEVATTGASVHFENYVQPLDRWLEVTAFRTCRGQVAVTFADVTQRKRAEEALRESEERFRALVTASSDVVYRMGPDWSEMRQLRGNNVLADTEAPNRNWLHEYIHPDDQARVTAAIHKAIRAKSIFELEHRVLRVDGSLGWTFSRAIPLQDANGEIVEWFGAASDVTERKQAEQRLRESEENYRTLFESIDEGFCTVKVIFDDNNVPVDYRFLEVNPAFERQTGIQNGRGRRMREIAPLHEPHWFEIYGKIALTGESARFENRAAQLHRWYDVHAFRVGKPLDKKVAILFNDITTRRQVEDALRESEQRNRILLDSTAEAIIGDDLEGKCTFCNPAAVRLLGYESPSELLGKNLHATTHHSRPDGTPLSVADCPLAEAVQAGRDFHAADLVFWRKDGTSFPVEGWSHPLWVEGRVTGSVVTFFDITERKQAEEEVLKLNQELEERVQQRTAQLDESEQRVRRKLESILAPEGDLGSLDLADILDVPAVQLLVDDFQSVTHLALAVIDIKGRMLASAGFQGICAKFHRVHPEACQNCHESDMELSAGVQPGEFKIYKCKNGLWDVATPLMVGGQHLGNLFTGQFFFVDEAIDYEVFRSQAKQYGFNEDEYLRALAAVPRITRDALNSSMAFLTKLAGVLAQLSYGAIKLARSTAETGRINAELEVANKELEAFSYSVSHDLRAPLRHISGFSQMLVEEFGPTLEPGARHYLDRIQSGTQKMGMLVDELLSLARVGRRPLCLQRTGLNEIVAEVAAMLEPDCEGRQVEWRIADLPTVQCDPVLVKQIFQNLLSNALKFTRPRARATIEVSYQPDHGQPVFMVRDNGIGFDMKYVDKLFGVFQRLHREEEFEGTGVGLATVQRIVHKHGGLVWVEAELDKGATFYFTLDTSKHEEVKANEAKTGGKL